jgi:hypothetical protein
MTRIAHPAYIDLGFRDSAGEFANFGVGVDPCNFSREPFHLFRKARVAMDWEAQSVAEGVSC